MWQNAIVTIPNVIFKHPKDKTENHRATILRNKIASYERFLKRAWRYVKRVRGLRIRNKRVFIKTVNTQVYKLVLYAMPKVLHLSHRLTWDKPLPVPETLKTKCELQTTKFFNTKRLRNIEGSYSHSIYKLLQESAPNLKSIILDCLYSLRAHHLQPLLQVDVTTLVNLEIEAYCPAVDTISTLLSKSPLLQRFACATNIESVPFLSGHNQLRMLYLYLDNSPPGQITVCLSILADKYPSLQSLYIEGIDDVADLEHLDRWQLKELVLRHIPVSSMTSLMKLESPLYTMENVQLHSGGTLTQDSITTLSYAFPNVRHLTACFYTCGAYLVLDMIVIMPRLRDLCIQWSECPDYVYLTDAKVTTIQSLAAIVPSRLQSVTLVARDDLRADLADLVCLLLFALTDLQQVTITGYTKGIIIDKKHRWMRILPDLLSMNEQDKYILLSSMKTYKQWKDYLKVCRQKRKVHINSGTHQ